MKEVTTRICGNRIAKEQKGVKNMSKEKFIKLIKAAGTLPLATSVASFPECKGV